jgi:malonate transporter and related proteins
MSWVVAARLAGIFAVIAVGWLAARTRTLGGPEVVGALSTTAFTVFTPALLLRTTARIDLATLAPLTLAAFFGPVVVLLLAVYGWQRWRRPEPAAGPAVRAISTSFGNTVQLGIPVATAVFGEVGLSLHVAIVSLHALVLLTMVTALVETDLARSGTAPAGGRAAVLRQTVRRTVVHPVVTPVLVGLAWNLLGVPLPEAVDGVLATLGQAVVPVSLVVIGMSLRQFGIAGGLRPALGLSAVKLLAQPGLVFVAAHWGAGLHGVPLGVVVMCAGLPIGSNALLFAQRYRTLEGETTAGIVISMLGFIVTAPLWLLALGHLAP